MSGKKLKLIGKLISLLKKYSTAPFLRHCEQSEAKERENDGEVKNAEL